MHWRAGIDIGGTFTDILLMDDATGQFTVGKVLTTPSEPAAAVRNGLEAMLPEAGVRASDLGTVVHGTTLVTNALIERKGALTALLVTQGFRDILLIGREHRYDMYDVRLEKPTPLVPRRLTFGVPERVLADGLVHRPLDEAAVRQIADELRAQGVRAVGVCLLHASAILNTNGGSAIFCSRPAPSFRCRSRTKSWASCASTNGPRRRLPMRTCSR